MAYNNVGSDPRAIRNGGKIDVDSDECRHRLLAELTSHIGEMNAIGMPALYQAVFDRPWSDRINDTRRVRKLITIMRGEGVPICSSASNGGGYYLAAAGSELAAYLRRDKFRALRILKRDAAILKISLPNYLGQLKMETEAGNEAA
ncbi:MAG: hypothetical protein WC436_05985 [Candidatus Babeliales bacterium]